MTDTPRRRPGRPVSPAAPRDLWPTWAECLFLDGLGGWHEGQRMPRLALLHAYQRTCWRRADWGTIDQARVLAHVRQAITQEEQTHG